MSWYDTGEAAEKKSEQVLEEQERNREENSKNRIFRFWMPPSKDDKPDTFLTFVDDLQHPSGYPLPFVFNEHQLQINGNWKNWFTCPGDGCPLCASGDRPSLVAAFTVIDHSEWTDKKGKVHKDELKLYMAKTKVNKILRKMMKKKGSLRGWKCEVTRATGESPSTGDGFDFEDRITLSDDIQPPDYMELFKPKSMEDLAKVVKGEADLVDADDDTVKF